MMIRLGDTINVTKYHGVRKMWLVKNPGLKKYTDKVYVVLGLVSDGWCTLNNGTLKEMRAWMEQYR